MLPNVRLADLPGFLSLEFQSRSSPLLENQIIVHARMHPTQMVESELLLTEVLGMEMGAAESKQRYPSAPHTSDAALSHTINSKLKVTKCTMRKYCACYSGQHPLEESTTVDED